MKTIMDSKEIELQYELCNTKRQWSDAFLLIKYTNGNDHDISWINESECDNKEFIKLFKSWKKYKNYNNEDASDIYPDDDFWGDKIGTKRYNDIRISMENINNIGKMLIKPQARLFK